MYEIAPVRPSEPLGDEIARRLRFLVVTGRLAPGTHLVEDRLAKDFDVSRGPIRDALRLLTAEGLLESRRRGTYVTGFTADDIEELYSLREAMESLALTLAMGRSEAASWAALDEPVRAMRRAADAADTEAFAAADLDFHSRFYQLSGHRRLISVWEHYRPTFSVLLAITNAQDLDLHPAAGAHATLLERVRAGDLADAVTELAAHLLGSKERLLRAHGEPSS